MTQKVPCAARWAPQSQIADMCKKIGAGDEIRTHDPNLGKVMLYP